jgi:hypothetical protein
MQTIGTVLVAVRQRSVVRMWMLALSSRCAHGLLYVTAVRRRTCQKDRSQVGGGPQPLALRRLSPREPPVPVAYVLAQLGPLDTELSTGDRRVRPAITVSLRVWLFEHGGLLTGTVSSDGAVAGVALMISPHTAIGLLFSRDLLSRRLCHAHPLPAHSRADLPKCCSLVRGKWQR